MESEIIIERPSEEDRLQFRDALRGFLNRSWPSGSAIDHGADIDKLKLITKLLAEQGIFALGSVPSEGGFAEVIVACEEMGRASCRAPVITPMLLNVFSRLETDLQSWIASKQATWHMGESVPALSFAQQDADKGAGHITIQGGLASGNVQFVEAANIASDLIVAISPNELAVISLDQPDVQIVDGRTFDLNGMFEVVLDRVQVTEVIELKPAVIPNLIAFSRLAHAARALGAASRAFDLVVEYAKERFQFGQAIGSFQAVQHKLANCHIALKAVDLTVANAALQFDLNSPDWRWYVAVATSIANESLRKVSLETHHIFGAIGYSEEHEATRHFRCVHADVTRHGGARCLHEELASSFIDHDEGFPKYDLGQKGNDFRMEVRAWLDRHWNSERKRTHDVRPYAEREYNEEFARALGKTGWIGLSWPRQFGGQGRSTLEQLAFLEEMERVEAPRVGAPVQALMLQMYGSASQQEQYLPEILRGEAMFGMGYSEPDAGSDLAALKTKAVRDGDEYVINGQKIWTTTYWGKYMLLAARTNNEVKPPHAGLSMFIIPMSTPGIAIYPASTLYGGTFANVFYDNVRVPLDARIGKEGEGWKVLTGALAIERGLVGGGIVLKAAQLFESVCSYLRTMCPEAVRMDPVIRDRLGKFAAQIEAGRQMMLLCARELDKGKLDLADAAISKVYSGELLEQFCECAIDILGQRGALSQGTSHSILNGRLEQNLRHSLMWVISIGTNEIQRNLIAQRGLGLPR
ncbi:acyl-CoA dehydrogenase family protein [Advenella kashmirensis]